MSMEKLRGEVERITQAFKNGRTEGMADMTVGVRLWLHEAMSEGNITDHEAARLMELLDAGRTVEKAGL